MKQQQQRERLQTGCLLIILLLCALPSARADFELSDAKGRRILLKDNGSWSYIVDGKTPAVAANQAAPDAMAELQLTRRVEAPGGCRFDLTLSNKLPYEIGSLVPDFSAVRANNAVYSTRLLGFTSVKSGSKLSRELQFEGISCDEVSKLRVAGGDRCEMGELNKFSDVKSGHCLTLLRVLPSDLLKFEK